MPMQWVVNVCSGAFLKPKPHHSHHHLYEISPLARVGLRNFSGGKQFFRRFNECAGKN
jgi:hypothetical protein